MPSFDQMTALPRPVESPMNTPCTPCTVMGFELAMSTGIGIGRVLDGSLIALICAASPGLMPGCASRYCCSCSTVTPSDCTTRAFPCAITSFGIPPNGPVSPLLLVDDGSRKYCTTAGPPVMKSLLPSMLAGIGGGVRLTVAADLRAVSALNVNVAVVRGMTANRPAAALTPFGSCDGTRILRPDSLPAAAAFGTSYGFGGVDHVSVPKRANPSTLLMSFAVSGTATTCFG